MIPPGVLAQQQMLIPSGGGGPVVDYAACNTGTTVSGLAQVNIPAIASGDLVVIGACAQNNAGAPTIGMPTGGGTWSSRIYTSVSTLRFRAVSQVMPDPTDAQTVSFNLGTSSRYSVFCVVVRAGTFDEATSPVPVSATGTSATATAPATAPGWAQDALDLKIAAGWASGSPAIAFSAFPYAESEASSGDFSPTNAVSYDTVPGASIPAGDFTAIRSANWVAATIAIRGSV